MEQIYAYIYAIHQAGSFKSAAERLRVTPPALSIALKKYEEQIGTPVFDRKKHPLGLTPAGEVLIRGIERMLRDERRMNLELADLVEMDAGDLRVGSTHYVNTCVLAPLLSRYMALYPNIKIKVTETSSYEVINGFLDDVYDVAVCASRIERDFITHIPVFHDNLYWVIPNRFLSPSLIEAHAIPVQSLGGPVQPPPLPSLSVLGEAPFIALLPGDYLYEQASALFFQEKVVPQICMNVPQSTTAWHMACAGIGAALIPERMIRRVPPFDADISIFSFDSPLMKRSICTYCKTNQYIPAATKRFLALCRSIAL